MRPAIFLDRDGVIIENQPQYVRAWSDVQLFPAAIQALARLKDSPYRIVIVTNQSAIGRGLISLATADAINRRLLDVIQKAGGRVDGVYLCPHAPTDACECRKPQPGLLLQAARELNIDLPRSWMIGDAVSDVQAGYSAGAGFLALLRTGRGADQAKLLPPEWIDKVQVLDDLSAAVEVIIRQISA